MELLTNSCFTFFKIFLPSELSLFPVIVLNVNVSCSFLFVDLVSGSCPRNPIISVSCAQSFSSCWGESAIQESFWRRFISWVKSTIGRIKIKWFEYIKTTHSFNKKKSLSRFDKIPPTLYTYYTMNNREWYLRMLSIP
jgi:hypothetical protein